MEVRLRNVNLLLVKKFSECRNFIRNVEKSFEWKMEMITLTTLGLGILTSSSLRAI